MKALFLDRDGVINRHRSDYVTTVEQFELLPGALEALARVADLPLAVAVVTNQAAVGRGRMTSAALAEIHGLMLERVRAAGGRIDAVYACTHHPDDRCPCRKPRPGMLLQAARDLGADLEGSFFVGDSATDVQAASAAGCRSALVLTGQGRRSSVELARAGVRPDLVAADLLEGVTGILALGAVLERRETVAV